MIILGTDLNNINLDDSNYDEVDPETVIHIKLLVWRSKFEKGKALEKELNEELMLIAIHLGKWWKYCLSEDDNKEIKPIFPG